MSLPELVNARNQLTPLFSLIFEQIFNRFDVDKDGIFSEQELRDYAIYTNGQQFEKTDLEKIFEYVDTIKKDDGVRLLTKKGFLQMYACQSIADTKETWRDLEKHGFVRVELEQAAVRHQAKQFVQKIARQWTVKA